jgi:hypothetical protein
MHGFKGRFPEHALFGNCGSDDRSCSQLPNTAALAPGQRQCRGQWPCSHVPNRQDAEGDHYPPSWPMRQPECVSSGACMGNSDRGTLARHDLSSSHTIDVAHAAAVSTQLAWSSGNSCAWNTALVPTACSRISQLRRPEIARTSSFTRCGLAVGAHVTGRHQCGSSKHVARLSRRHRVDCFAWLRCAGRRRAFHSEVTAAGSGASCALVGCRARGGRRG